MSQVFAFSKPGIEVTTATDPDDFVFHSDYDTLKYESTGEFTLNVDLSNYYLYQPPDLFPEVYWNYKVGSLSHNLRYIPYFACYGLNFTSAGEAIQLPYAFGDIVTSLQLNSYADDTNLYFMAHFTSGTNSGTETFDFSYRIFKNDLGL